jgi:hypothetical protein
MRASFQLGIFKQKLKQMCTGVYNGTLEKLVLNNFRRIKARITDVANTRNKQPFFEAIKAGSKLTLFL